MRNQAGASQRQSGASLTCLRQLLPEQSLGPAGLGEQQGVEKLSPPVSTGKPENCRPLRTNSSVMLICGWATSAPRPRTTYNTSRPQVLGAQVQPGLTRSLGL